jgi:uncharacterized phage protein (TIGR02220 family)
MIKQPPLTRLLAIAILNYADDEGYFYADPVLVRGALMPAEEVEDIRRGLDELSRMGYMETREHPDHGLIGKVVAFEKHQRIDRPSGSKIKKYWLDEDSTKARRGLDAGTGNREQGTGNREEPPCSPPEEKKPDYTETDRVIDYLNEKTNSAYRHSKNSREPIHARLGEGFSVEDCCVVIDHKATEWLDDSAMQGYLRPNARRPILVLGRVTNNARTWTTQKKR